MHIARYAKSTQSNKFTISLQYLKENIKDEVDFLPADRRQKSDQSDTIILDMCGQACPNYPKLPKNGVAINGVAMGSPLSPTLANAFLHHYEKEWFDNCPSHFKPIVYRSYVDDIFVLFSSKEHLQPFVDYMNKQDRCIKFTSETEKNNTFSFLDINITRQNNQLKTSVYRKPTFSGVFIHYENYIDQSYKKSLIFTLLSRCCSICSDYALFHLEVEKLREIKKEQLSVQYYRSINKNFFK